jgi:hypothetical protein
VKPFNGYALACMVLSFVSIPLTLLPLQGWPILTALCGLLLTSVSLGHVAQQRPGGGVMSVTGLIIGYLHLAVLGLGNMAIWLLAGRVGE